MSQHILQTIDDIANGVARGMALVNDLCRYAGIDPRFPDFAPAPTAPAPAIEQTPAPEVPAPARRATKPSREELPPRQHAGKSPAPNGMGKRILAALADPRFASPFTCEDLGKITGDDPVALRMALKRMAIPGIVITTPGRAGHPAVYTYKPVSRSSASAAPTPTPAPAPTAPTPPQPPRTNAGTDTPCAQAIRRAVAFLTAGEPGRLFGRSQIVEQMEKAEGERTVAGWINSGGFGSTLTDLRTRGILELVERVPGDSTYKRGAKWDL